MIGYDSSRSLSQRPPIPNESACDCASLSGVGDCDRRPELMYFLQRRSCTVNLNIGYESVTPHGSDRAHVSPSNVAFRLLPLRSALGKMQFLRPCHKFLTSCTLHTFFTLRPLTHES